MQTYKVDFNENVRTVSAIGAIDLSVVIVNYNGYDDLHITLPALFENLPDHSEVIIVDNGSTDASLDFIQTEFPQVCIARNDRNTGFGQGNNLGAMTARGDYLLFLNPDTKPEANFATELIEPLKHDESIGMTTSKVLIMKHPDYINTCGNSVHITGLTLCRGYMSPRDDEDYSQPTSVSAVSGAAFAMRRSLFEELGGFGKLFFLYMEDTDLSLRVRLAGYKCMYVPTSIVHHDYSLRIGDRKIYLQERNRYIMLLKIYQWRTLLLLLPVLILSEVIAWGFVLLKERKNYMNKIYAYRDVYREWDVIMEQREKTQSLRRVTDKDMLAITGYSLEFEQTGKGLIPTVAHILFDPLFFAWRYVVLNVI